MTEYEKGYKDAQIKIIQNKYNIDGEWLFKELKRLEKEIGLPSEEIYTIMREYRAQLIKKEFDQIVAESDTKEEAVYHLIVVSHFVRDYVIKHLDVTDEFIDHTLYDKDVQYKSMKAVYNKLKNKENRSSDEETFYNEITDGIEEGQREAKIEVVQNMYKIGKTTDEIKNILKNYVEFTDDEIKDVLQAVNAKSNNTK